MTEGREQRYAVDFPVFLSWQVNDAIHRVTARCVNLSPSGAKLETKDRLEPRTMVLVHSERFGRMGMASIRYARKSSAPCWILPRRDFDVLPQIVCGDVRRVDGARVIRRDA
jgi:hypothetical protein